MIIKANLGHTTSKMIGELNSAIRGWANYHRYVCSKKTFHYVDACIFRNLWHWARRRHQNKGAQWIRNRYFRKIGSRNWSFFATQKTRKSESKAIDLFYMSQVQIVRHIKICKDANPYDKDWQKYFSKRSMRKYYSAVSA
jgi:RNA-directed DNA polymerase